MTDKNNKKWEEKKTTKKKIVPNYEQLFLSKKDQCMETTIQRRRENKNMCTLSLCAYNLLNGKPIIQRTSVRFLLQINRIDCIFRNF